MVVFFSLLNMAGVNSQIIFASNTKTYDIERREYLIDLGLNLAKRHMIRRSLETSVPPNVRERR